MGWCALRLSLLMCIVGCQLADEQPPHVVIVSIDTLNRDALRAFASSALPLPTLDAFAGESIRFTNAYSTASWTLPAHASLMTGLYPDRHGAHREMLALGTEASTVAEALRAVGYETVAFVGGAFLNSRYGLSRGFDLYDDQPGRQPDAAAADPASEEQAPLASGEDTYARAIAYLSQRPRDAGPLFLFLHTYSVHQYYKAHEWALARLGDEGIENDSSRYIFCLHGLPRCSAQDWDRMRALYRAEVEHLDVVFGRLVAALERAQVWNRSVVFFLSDHGEGFDIERQRIHHGGRLHVDQLHIPLLVRVPGGAPRDETAPVSLVDVMPTILELTGAAPLADLDGRSFAATLDGKRLPGDPRPLYAMEHNYAWNDLGMRKTLQGSRQQPAAVAVIEGRHWYIRDLWSDELYDMQADRSQRRNLASEAADLDSYRRLLADRSRWRTAPIPIQHDEELIEQLRSLGYAR
jgi:arylsulfatase A-like enzyme